LKISNDGYAESFTDNCSALNTQEIDYGVRMYQDFLGEVESVSAAMDGEFIEKLGRGNR
jgi:hypothetical protein